MEPALKQPASVALQRTKKADETAGTTQKVKLVKTFFGPNIK